MNLLIKHRGTNEVHSFLEDVVQKSEKEFVGSNGSIVLKPDLFDLVFTTDCKEDLVKDGKVFKEPSKPLSFKDRPVSTKAEINELVKKAIRERYSIDDELKAIRLGVIDKQDPYWLKYVEDVGEAVNESNLFIEENRLK